MAKRMVTNFSRAAYPTYERIDEEGQAKPAIFGVAWVNPDTVATIKKHGGRRTGPHGEPWVGPATRAGQAPGEPSPDDPS